MDSKIKQDEEDEKKYNEMMKPLTYRPPYDRKYKYRHEDLIWRSKYRAMKGRLKSLKRLHLLYDPEDDQELEQTPRHTKEATPRDLKNIFLEDVGMFSVFSDDTSTKGPSVKLARDTKSLFRDNLHHTELKTNQKFGGFDVPLALSHYGQFKRSVPEVRTTTDGALRDYSKDRVQMWNLNLRNDPKFVHFNQAKDESGRKNKKAVKIYRGDKTTLSRIKVNSEVQTEVPVTRRDSFDLTHPKESSKDPLDETESDEVPKLELKVDLDRVNISAIDYLDGFDRRDEQECLKMINVIYFKTDEDIVTSIYVLKSDIPSVQLMNRITVRVPAKIRYDSEKLNFSVRMKIGLVWRRLNARFEDSPGNNIFEGYIVFRTEHRGNFFATCDFIQFTYKIDKYGYKFKNSLIPDIQAVIKGGAVEEPEDVTFQVRLVDRERFSKYENLSPRLIYPVVYVSEGLWIRRNKSLYARKITPLLISISNDTSYGVDNEVYLIRETQGRINIIGERKKIDKKFIVLLDNFHSTFWYVITKEINKYRSYEHFLERGFSVATARTCVCKILTFHENRKEEFVIWVCIVEHPDVSDTISKYLDFYGMSGNKRLEISEMGGVSHSIDFTSNTPGVNIELDVNFKQRFFKELPTLKFKSGHSCRVQFKAKCRITPLLCDDIEKIGIIRYIVGTKNIHEVQIDTARPAPDLEDLNLPVEPEFSKEAIEKLLSAESLHNIAACLTEDQGFDVSLRLGLSAERVSKILIMYGSVESKNFRLLLQWKKNITSDVEDIKNFINTFYDCELGDIALGITDALENCQPFPKMYSKLV